MKHSNGTDKQEQGAPASVITSVLVAAPLLIILLINDLIYDSQAGMAAMVVAAFMLVGMGICFFWRRFQQGNWRRTFSGLYLASFWSYLPALAVASALQPNAILLTNLTALCLLAVCSALVAIDWLRSSAKQAVPMVMGFAGLGASLFIAVSFFESNFMTSMREASSGSGITISASDYSGPESTPVAEQSRPAGQISQQAEPVLSLAAKTMPIELKTEAAEAEADSQNQKNRQAPRQTRTQNLLKDQALWSYDSRTGPYQWGNLSREYRLCGRGQEQSPIDIPRYWQAHSELKLSYQPSPYRITNLGYSFQVSPSRPQDIRIQGQLHQLEHIQFRSPSEHLLAGQAHPMEIQLFHRNQNGEPLVVSIFAKIGKKHDGFEELWAKLPANNLASAVTHDQQINIQKFIPQDQKAYRYFGSMTTPPCREGVTWQVLRQPIEISRDQLQAFRDRYHFNARPPQALNYR